MHSISSRLVAPLCVALTLTVPARADDDDSLKQRIEAVQQFPEWQKKPLSRPDLLSCLQQLQSGDVATQRDALEKLALAEPTPQMRDTVFQAAKRVHDQHDDRFSQAMVSHINACWSEAETAANVLRIARRSGGLKFLERVLKEGNPLERGQALAALGYYGQPEAAELIVAHFDENSGIAARSLAILGPPVAPTALKLLDHADWTIRDQGANVLAKIGTEQEIPRLQELTSDSNGVVKMSATRAIEAIRHRAAATDS